MCLFFSRMSTIRATAPRKMYVRFPFLERSDVEFLVISNIPFARPQRSSWCQPSVRTNLSPLSSWHGLVNWKKVVGTDFEHSLSLCLQSFCKCLPACTVDIESQIFSQVHRCSKFLPGRSSDPLVLQGFWWKTYRKEEGTRQGSSGHLRFSGDDPGDVRSDVCARSTLLATSPWRRSSSRSWELWDLLKLWTALCNAQSQRFSQCLMGVFKSCIQWSYVLFLLKEKQLWKTCQHLHFPRPQKPQELQLLHLQLKVQHQRQQQAVGIGVVAVCISFHFIHQISMNYLWNWWIFSAVSIFHFCWVDRFLYEKLVDPTNSFSSLWVLDELIRIFIKSPTHFLFHAAIWAKRRKGEGQSVWKPSKISLWNMLQTSVDVALTFFCVVSWYGRLRQVMVGFYYY